jgi:branched-chain amino acid transport system permease protein
VTVEDTTANSTSTPAAAAIRRRGRSMPATSAAATILLALLAMLPFAASRVTTYDLVELFTFAVLGTMWNLMAGYGGMVSIGQQAFVGAGSYAVVWFTNNSGVNPFLGVPIAAAVCGLLALPTSYLVFRLAGGYFAIGTWVVAEVAKLFTTQVGSLGKGSGVSLQKMSSLDPVLRNRLVYWLALSVLTLAVASTYMVMRSSLGLALTAVRDAPVAASTLGVNVARSKRLVYIAAAAGFGAAGAVTSLHTLRVEPDSAYSVQLTAYMIFIVVIGGMGSIEGPLLGAVVFWVMQRELASLGEWYLIILGTVAVVVTLYARNGLWGLLSRGRAHAFPVGYVLGRAPRDARGFRSRTDERSDANAGNIEGVEQ